MLHPTLFSFSLAVTLFFPAIVRGQTLDLEHVRTLETKPFAGGAEGVGDSESLTYCPAANAFFIGDDVGNAVHHFSRSDGRFLLKVTAQDLIDHFPAAGQCDNGAGGACSYTNELETVACDPADGSLYIVNTVNIPALSPPKDRQAIYRLRRNSTGGLDYESWHPLTEGIDNKLDAIVVISGRLYGGGGTDLVEYDYQKEDYATRDAQGNVVPVYTSSNGSIVGLAYQCPYLWVLTGQKKLVRVDWTQKADAGIGDVASVGGVTLGNAKGLAVALGEIYVVDGDPPHHIFELRITGGGDADGDGMPDHWETQFDLDPSDPTDATLDSDGDGVLNLAEYQAFTNPTDPASGTGSGPGSTEGNGKGGSACGLVGFEALLLVSLLAGFRTGEGRRRADKETPSNCPS